MAQKIPSTQAASPGSLPNIQTEHLPQTLKDTAAVLREEGCSESEIRLALLSLCGVTVSPVSLLQLRTPL